MYPLYRNYLKQKISQLKQEISILDAEYLKIPIIFEDLNNNSIVDDQLISDEEAEELINRL